MESDFGQFSKDKQLGKQGKSLTAAEKDARQRALFIFIYESARYREWGIASKENQIIAMDTGHWAPKDSVEIDHILSRSTNPERKYDLDNLQIITASENRKKKAEKRETDYRPDWFKKIVNRLAY